MELSRRARPARCVRAVGLVVVLLALLPLLAACGPERGAARGRIPVAAGAWPLAEAARWVGGPRVVVHDLTPAGAEPHDLEVTTVQMDRILDSGLALVVGGGFQPAVEDAAARRDGPTLTALDVPGVGGTDPHVWLDPVAYRAVVDALARRLVRLDPAHASIYRARARRADRTLDALDARTRQALALCARRTVLTSHDAFSRFGRRYSLRFEPIAGVDPEQEPDPRRLAALTALARRTRATTIFTEETVSPQVAAVIAREVGLRTAVLSPLETRTPGRASRGYVARMDADVAALVRGLGCVSR